MGTTTTITLTLPVLLSAKRPQRAQARDRKRNNELFTSSLFLLLSPLPPPSSPVPLRHDDVLEEFSFVGRFPEVIAGRRRQGGPAQDRGRERRVRPGVPSRGAGDDEAEQVGEERWLAPGSIRRR